MCEKMKECPICGDNNLIAEERENELAIGPEDSPLAILSFRAPVHICAECGLEFHGPEWDEAAHEAQCEHMRLLAPKQVRKIRLSYKMSRKEFAKNFGFGEATLERWENGRNLQNRAMDNYLRFLENRSLGAFLMNQASDTVPSQQNVVDFQKSFPRLSVIEDVIEREQKFCLRPKQAA